MKEKKKTADFVFILLELDGLPRDVKNILTEKSDGKEEIDIDDLSFDMDEIVRVSTAIYPQLKDLLLKIQEEKKTFDTSSLVPFEAAISLVEFMVLVLPEEEATPEPLMQIISFLNRLLDTDFYHKTKNKISKVCELCCYKRCRLSTNFILDTWNFMLKNSLDVNKVKVQDVKRVWKIHDSVKMINYRSPPFENFLLQTVESNAYLSCKEGQQFIAYLLTLNVDLTKKVHEAIKDCLVHASKAQATAFGNVYHKAWLNSEKEERQVIEKYCLQDLMSRIFELNRAAGFVEMSKLGKNVLAVLSVLHAGRRLVHLSKMITELYTPLIWRHIRSGNNIIRSNATEVFLDVYPLENPGTSRSEQVVYLQRQHDEMADLLTDDCHVVRILGVKGICNCLRNLWETFKPESIQKLMDTIVNDMINDGSSPDVRKAVYQGFSKMLTNPSAVTYLAKVLPSLNNHVHDENEKVRRAFVEMLIRIKELDSEVLKYWNIVPAAHLTARLELEREDVGKPLVQLLMSEFYSPDKPMNAILKRICRIILMNKAAARKLFMYSKKILPLKSAVELMLSILAVLRNHLKEMEENHARTVHAHNHAKKKRKRVGLHLRERNTDVDSSVSSGDSSVSSTSSERESLPPPRQTHHLDNPVVSHAFIDIVTILWGLHGGELCDPDNEGLSNDLQDLAANTIPIFLKHYKGTDSFFATIHLASFTPLSKLSSSSTISSMCMSQLKSMTSESRNAETEVYVNALCAWNRGPDILELATDWLDQTFRLQQLNKSAMPRSSARQRKVKFKHGEANPLNALQLLDNIFASHINKTRLMKNYTAVFELFAFLETIKPLVERRINLNAPYPDSAISDKFLELCLHRYAKLILILNRGNTNDDTESMASSDLSITDRINRINAPQVFADLLDWTTRILVPAVPDRLDTDGDLHVAVKLLNVVARTGCLAISVNYVTSELLHNFINFVDTLLNTGCRVAFANVALIALRELCANSEAHFEKDEERFLRISLPSLFDKIMMTMGDDQMSKENLAKYVTSITEMKKCLLCLPLTLVRSFGQKSQTLVSALAAVTTTTVDLIAREMREVEMFCSVEKIQSLPYGSSYIVSAILTRENLTCVWLQRLTFMISTSYCNDSLQLLATISLLFTLSFIAKPKLKEKLIDPAKKAHECVVNFKMDGDKSTTEACDADISDSHVDQADDGNSTRLSLDVKKSGLSALEDIAKRLGCTLK